MKYEVFEGKTEEEAKEKALTELNISENECLTHVEKNTYRTSKKRIS